MKEKLVEYIHKLLQEKLEALFAQMVALKKVKIKISHSSDGEFPYPSYQILLTLEDRSPCPDGAIAVVDIERDITYYGDRNPVEKKFAESIREVVEYLWLAFGDCTIEMNREDKELKIGT